MEFFSNRTTFLTIFGLEVKWYAVLILFGAFCAYKVSQHNLKKKAYKDNVVDDLIFGCLICGVIGARLYYVLFYHFNDPEFFANLINIIDFRQGGLAIHGGLIAGLLYGIYYAKKHNLSCFKLSDNVIYTMLLAQAIGRWGNFINQEAFGPVINQQSLAFLPQFIQDGMYIDGAYRMPMFLIESSLNIVGFLIIHFLLKKIFKKTGQVTGLYFIWYGIVRYFVESYRTDALWFFGYNLKVAQLISGLLILCGLVLLVGIIKERKAILYDFDGTLLDTREMIEKSFGDLINQFPPKVKVTPELLASFVGPSLSQSFIELYGPQYPENLFIEYQKAKQNYIDTVTLMPNINDCLTQLKTNGYLLGIVSNKGSQQIKEQMELYHLYNDFDVIIGNDLVKMAKPDPAGINLACQKLKVTYDNCLYVGDTTVDAMAAKNAGVFFVGYGLLKTELEKVSNLYIDDHNKLLDGVKNG